jgi:hypothetical protein
MRTVKILFFIVGLVLGIVEAAFGDGVAYSGLDYSSMRPVKEGEQRAVIIHRNGIEKMLIAVSLELGDANKGLWIFPVPSDPNTVKLDVLDSFPVFEGVEPSYKAKGLFERIAQLTLATQIYPLPFVMMSTFSLARARHDAIAIHYEVEKWGVHTEAVSAGSIEDLRGYLKGKGVGIETEALKAFEDYLSDKYVLVLAWISSRKELIEEFEEYGKTYATINYKGRRYKRFLNERWPSLYVEFATDKAFYPMRPTSSYGEEQIDITLTILDYVQTNETHPYIYTRYYRQSKAVENTPSKIAQDLSSKDIRYTRISFHDEARNLNNDLWFIPNIPRDIRNAESIVSILGNSFAFYIVLSCMIIFFSWVTGGLTGLVLFQRWKGYARLGLWNILTIAGLCIASYKVKGIVGERFGQTDRFPGRWTFNVLFSIFYLLIAGYFMFVLMLILENFL